MTTADSRVDARTHTGTDTSTDSSAESDDQPREVGAVRGVAQHAEMAGWLGLFHALAWTRGTQRLVERASRLADRFGDRSAATPDLQKNDRLAERARLLSERVSRLIPGTRCLHRALASRVWLARRGVAAEVVIGVRKGGAIEGHAWLEVDGPAGLLRPFYDPSAGWREVLRG